MKILYSMTEMSALDEYKMTQGSGNKKLKDHLAGQTVTLENCVIFEDERADKESGEVKTTRVAVIKVNGEYYGTNSPSFVREIHSMISHFESRGLRVTKIKVRTGSTSRGTFIGAEPVEDGLLPM